VKKRKGLEFVAVAGGAGGARQPVTVISSLRKTPGDGERGFREEEYRGPANTEE